jgi:glycosyltransferase involved in cell wall biosynthesis
VSARPLVSVLLPIYNSAEFLADTLESLRLQELEDFEVLALVEHGSRDASVEILEGFRDPRFRVVQNTERLGLPKSLNRGFEEARGRFIARMDADDIAYAARFRRQVETLEARPELGLCGTFAQLFGQERWVFAPSTESEAIRAELLLGCTFVHPTVMFRADTVRKHGLRYDAGLVATEDYELWTRAATLFPMANIPEILLGYRKHGSAATHRHEAEGRRVYRKAMEDQLIRMGAGPSKAELDLHHRLFTGGFAPAALPVPELIAWLDKLIETNDRSGYYNREIFRNILQARKQEFQRHAVEALDATH